MNTYTTSHAVLYHGDAIAVMETLPSGSVDVIFADPPYNLSNGGITCQSGRMVSVDKAAWDKSQGVEADYAFHAAWIAACRRVLADTGTLWISGTYHSIYACGHALQQGGWHLLNDLVWFKPNASPNLSCRMFTASHETLLWAKKTHRARHYFNDAAMRDGDWGRDILKKPGRQMRSVWAIATSTKAEKAYGKHPTQKPEALLERIIQASCPPGGLVLDPFCGSGTTGVVALRHKARFIGIDTESAYLEQIALPRLKAVT